VLINGKSYYSYNKKVTGPMPKSITVNPISDQAFKEAMPKDAVYRIVECKVSLNRGTQVMALQKIYSNSVGMEMITGIARPGDVISFVVKGMKRQNAVGDWLSQELLYSTILYTIQ
jgi:hypothetical protein